MHKIKVVYLIIIPLLFFSCQDESANTVNHEDVVIFDGSASTLDVKRFLGDSIGDKYTLADTHRELRISALGGNKFTLHNHNFKDKQKITFDLANLTVADYYLEKSSWNPDSFNGTIKDFAERFDQVFVCASNRNAQLGLMALLEFSPGLVMISGLHKTKKSDIKKIKSRQPIDVLFYD